MPLDKDGLRDALVAMMTDAQEKSWTKGQVADALATAIDVYVRAGVVADVTVALADGTPLRQSNRVGLR